MNTLVNKCEKCVQPDKSKCIQCRDNEMYKNVPTRSLYMEYIPVCPQGWDDCVRDPAYIKFNNPDWYKELYGDLTPEEVAKTRCDINDEYCYDDENK